MPQDDIAVERASEAGRRKANIAEEKVVLVNERDEMIGVENKTQAHLLGALHRAFSVFILNADGQLLLQKRAQTKYHSKGLWSNTCCGHPRPGESIERASQRRLWEEMGFDSDLRKLFDFIYRANVDEGLIEYEYDHILLGWFDGTPQPDPNEIAEWKWADLRTLSADIEAHPESYTYWFRISFNRFLREIAANAFVR
jgi:isopentenyl-diphosphate delta-isomerase